MTSVSGDSKEVASARFRQRASTIAFIYVNIDAYSSFPQLPAARRSKVGNMKVRTRHASAYEPSPGRCNKKSSSSSSHVQEVVVDARAHMLGRLASTVAKQALAGHHVVRLALSCEWSPLRDWHHHVTMQRDVMHFSSVSGMVHISQAFQPSGQVCCSDACPRCLL
jgi:hypothetical protein